MSSSKKDKTTEAALAQADAHLAFLDYLRGMAIAMVFVYHCAMATYGSSALALIGHTLSWNHLFLFLPSLGWAGVSVFFVISGFCIHLSHIRSREKGFRTFFIRRFFRIYPPYLVALLLFAVILPMKLTLFETTLDIRDFIFHLFLIHNLNVDTEYTVNGSFWSIGVEVQLYLLYPLLLWLVGRLGWRNCMILVFAIEMFFVNSASVMYHLGFRGQSINLLPPKNPFTYWFSWTIGVKIADDWLACRISFFNRIPVWIWPCFFLVTCLVRPLAKYGFSLAAISTAALLAVHVLRPSNGIVATRLPFSRHLCHVGLISYSIYLIHQPLIDLIIYLIDRITPALSHSHPLTFTLSLFGWPIILLLSWIFCRFFEIPSIALGKTISRRNRLATREPTIP